MMPSARRWVLLVDDDIDACDMLGAILEKRGVRARCLYSASEAIDLLDQLAATPDQLPALVMTDLLMPGIGGAALVRHIARQRGLRDVRTAVMTATPDFAPAGAIVFPKPMRLGPVIDFVSAEINRDELELRAAGA